MGAREDIEDLKFQISKSMRIKNQEQTAKLLKMSFIFCEKIKKEVEGASDEEKKEISALMQEFRSFLQKEVKQLSGGAGLTEDEFLRYNENPDNFSTAQWKAMQAIRQSFSKKTREIRKVMSKKSPLQGKELSDHLKKAIIENSNILSIKEVPATGGRKKVSPKRARRSKWMKT